MKKKRGDPDKPSGHSRLTPAKKRKVVSSDSRRDEQNSNQSVPTSINRMVSIRSIFHRLFQDLGHRQISTITKPHEQHKRQVTLNTKGKSSLTPTTPINKRKCVLGKF